MKTIIQQHPAHQCGIVLVMALLILMVMTVIGTSMLSTATLEERMANNLQTSNATFQAANSCFKDTINAPPGADFSVTLNNALAVDNVNIPQTNTCNDPAAGVLGIVLDLYGTDFNTQATVTANSQSFTPRGYDLNIVNAISVPITVTASIPNAGTGVTLQISGGVITPK